MAPLNYEECLSQIPASFATVSIGSPKAQLPYKLKAIASAGFKGIELGFPDLQTYAGTIAGKDVAEDDYESLREAAAKVKELCTKLGLEIMMLQPFANFEGWHEGSKEKKDAYARAEGWISIMKAAGVTLLQVGSTDSENIRTDHETLVGDLQHLADLLKTEGFRMAYENWCWSTHAPDWKNVWEIVKKVDRDNVGLCLDTFQTAGGEWGDPTTKTGRVDDVDEEELRTRYAKSLDELSKTVPKEKIYLLQLSDAYKLPEPMSKEKDDSGLRPRGRWSHDHRPLPFDGGYLPIVEFTTAVLKTGFRNWFSMEVFDASKGLKAETDSELEQYAKQAMESHKRLLREATA